MKAKGLFQKAKHVAIEVRDKDGLARIMRMMQKEFGSASEEKQAQILAELEGYIANPPPPRVDPEPAPEGE